MTFSVPLYLKNCNLFRKTKGTEPIDFLSRLLKREGIGVMICHSVGCCFFSLTHLVSQTGSKLSKSPIVSLPRSSKNI
jgi:hypothetical protein